MVNMGAVPAPLFSPDDASPGVLCPILVSSVQEIPATTGMSPEKGYEDNQETRAPHLERKAEVPGLLNLEKS